MTSYITEALELIAAAEWIILGIIVFARTRKMQKRLDKIVEDMERDVEREIAGGPWK